MTMYGSSIPSSAHYDGSSANMFGSPPFSGQKRRKRGDVFARWTTKAVLLSPVVILCLWSIVVMFSSSKTLQQTPSAQAVRVPVRPHSKQAQRIPVRPHHMGVTSQFSSNEMFMNAEQASSIVQPANSGEQSQQYLTATGQDRSNVVVRPRPHPRNIHDGKILPVYSPLGNTQLVDPGIVMNTVNANLVPLELSESQSYSQGESELTTMSAVQNAASTIDYEHAMTSQLDQSHIIITSALGSKTNSVLSPVERQSIPVINPLGSTDLNLIVRPRPSPQKTSHKTTILYYDPDTATVDGQLYVPQVVYDENGTEINLQALQASLNAEVYMEPPPIGQPMKPIDVPLQQISRQDLKRYVAEPPVQDQYIIIATVAVMALLVGALSARRMRSRNFLSSCIENEALEEEVAYDVATTNGDYSTFGGNTMFRGDLEKFDV